ncbi:hypothetical protein [Desulfovibrio sp. JC010]|uniref:hypothetical protein n=1 Tax=Desulfovibrio sp. JC010 TaxID=2593641 RepID=UPI0013D8DC25|nr:hypothetical protein [Desulfovibrio sp. JC010]NDV28673.1 hypothetical protein [Desulfovibrio sp. JC010]
MENYRVVGERETNTFAYMFIGAKQMLEQAQASDVGALYNRISCIVFCAFTLEAYFNHFGALRDKKWNKIERNIPKFKKYEKFCNQLNLEVNFDVAPYSTIKEIFSFRDTMAHGKTTIEDVTKDVCVPNEQINRFTLGASWEEYATKENAQKAIKHTQKIIVELHQAAGLGDNPFAETGSAFFAMTKIS